MTKCRKSIFANALLSDGEILFWWTGRDKCGIGDFYKDFYFAKINMADYAASHRLEVKSMEFKFYEEDEDAFNNFCFETLAKDFYRQFKISPDSKGKKPYC